MPANPRNSSPVDAIGAHHPPAGDSARIVSLVPSITELLFGLGLGERVVGRTTFCIHPREAVASVPRVGGTKKVRIDKLRALAPTHVIVNIDENDRDQVDEISAFVDHVMVTHPIEPRDNLSLYRLVGHVFGATARAEALCRGFESEYRVLRRAAEQFPPQRVLYLIWREPWMTVSRSTYISRMLALVNWTTVLGDEETRYPEVTLSPDTATQTDRILLSSEPFPFKPEHREEVLELVADPGVPVAFIDAEMVSWYGDRAIRGLQYLREYVASELVT